jgi:hypothetical protein
MNRSTSFRSLSVLLGAILISACTEPSIQGPTAPASAVSAQNGAASQKGADGGGTLTNASQIELKALWWNKKHSDVVRVSKTIGAEGGTISVPQTGLTIVFPEGAVSSPLTITVTSDDKYVAYKMEPAGTQFLKDVTVTQQLSLTEVAGSLLRNQLFAAYIADDNLKLSGRVPVLEIEPSTTVRSALGLPQAQVWNIRHFSRYMLASD